MGKRLFFRLALSSACAAICGTAQAIDLVGAYRAALANDATFLSVKAAAGATREVVPQARSQLLPQLSANVSKLNNDTRTERAITSGGRKYLVTDRNPDYGSSNGTLVLRQPLFRLANIAGYSQALAMAEGADASEDKGRQDLAQRVTSAYLEALLALDTEVQLKAQRDSYEAQLKAAKKSFAAGQGTRTDIEEAQARYDNTAAQLIAARSQIEYAVEQLQAIVNQPITVISPLVADRIKLEPPEPRTLDEWVALGEAGSPELKRLFSEVESAESEVLKARAGHFPTVDLVAQRSRSENDMVTAQNTTYLNTQVGVQVSIPIFSSGYVSSTVAEARQHLEKARQDYEAARRNLRVQLRQQYQGVKDGIEQIQALEQALRSAAQALQGTLKGVQAGTRTTLDVLNAEEKRSTALRDLSQARYRYLMARVSLYAYAGSDSFEEIQRINNWLGEGKALMP